LRIIADHAPFFSSYYFRRFCFDWISHGGLGHQRKMHHRNLRSCRDRCFDFKNIFAKKNCEKIGVFCSKQS
jgi:hypothetical protein